YIDVSDRKPPMSSALLALLCIALAGMVSVAAQVITRGTAWGAGILFALSVTALIYLQSDLQRAWQNSAYALTPFVLSMQPAYWVVVTLTSLGALINIYVAVFAPRSTVSGLSAERRD